MLAAWSVLWRVQETLDEHIFDRQRGDCHSLRRNLARTADERKQKKQVSFNKRPSALSSRQLLAHIDRRVLYSVTTIMALVIGGWLTAMIVLVTEINYNADEETIFITQCYLASALINISISLQYAVYYFFWLVGIKSEAKSEQLSILQQSFSKGIQRYGLRWLLLVHKHALQSNGGFSLAARAMQTLCRTFARFPSCYDSSRLRGRRPRSQKRGLSQARRRVIIAHNFIASYTHTPTDAHTRRLWWKQCAS